MNEGQITPVLDHAVFKGEIVTPLRLSTGFEVVFFLQLNDLSKQFEL